MYRLLPFFCLLVGICPWNEAFSISQVAIDESTHIIEVNKYAEFLVDEDSLPFPTARKKLFDQSLPVLPGNFAPQVYWARFMVFNSSDRPLKLLLGLDSHIVRRVDIYYSSGEKYRWNSVSASSPMDQRKINWSNPILFYDSSLKKKRWYTLKFIA